MSKKKTKWLAAVLSCIMLVYSIPAPVTAADKMTAQTAGVSCYTLNFAYNDLQYEMEGDSSVSLSTILDNVGLSGTVISATSSDEEAFDVTQSEEEWIIRAKKGFVGTKTLTVAIESVEYEITVSASANVTGAKLVTWYAYDCQRIPSYPREIGEVTCLNNFDCPYSAEHEPSEAYGPWTLNFYSKYDGTNEGSEAVQNTVDCLREEYQVAEETIDVYEVKQRNEFIGYAIIIAKVGSGYLAELNGFYGYYFCDKMLSDSDIIEEGAEEVIGAIPIESIEITDYSAPKKEYLIGEEFDSSNIWIMARKSDGSKNEFPVTNSMISGFDGNQEGEQTVTITYAGKTATFQIMVGNKDPELAVEPVADKTYGDEEFNLEVSNNGDGTLTYESSDDKVLTVDENGKVTVIGAGEATITISVAKSTNYKSDTETVKVKVLPKAITVKADNKTKTYGEEDKELTYTVSELVGTDKLEGIVLSRKEGEAAATYEITVSQKEGENSNYSILFVSGTYTIEPKHVTEETIEVTFVDSNPIIYDGTPKRPGIKVWYGDKIIPDTQYDVSYKNNTNAGKATITIVGKNSYTFEKTVEFTIAQADLKLLVKPVADKTYGDEAFNLEVSNNGDGILTYESSDDKVLTVDESGNVTVIGVGEATITISVAETANCLAASTKVDVNVAPKNITVTADNKEITYGDAEVNLTYGVNKGGLVGADELSDINLTRENGEDAGDYKITVSQEKGANSNYNIKFVGGTYTIKPKEVKEAVVTLKNKLVENGKEQTQIIESIFVDGVEVDYTVEGNKATAAGAHTMKIIFTGNYTGTKEVKWVILPESDDSTVKIDEIGTFYVGVQCDEKVPKIYFATGKRELVSILASANELSKAANGDPLSIWLKVKDGDSTISEVSKKAIASNISDYEVGKYMDISLFKQLLSTEKAVQITETEKTIKISVVVPDELLNKDHNVTRTFGIARNHNGKVEILPTTFDEKANILTFETDQFSDYAIIYKDKVVDKTNENAGNNDTQNNNKLNTVSPKTGDISNPVAWLFIMIIALAGMLLTLRNKKEIKNNFPKE